MKKGSTMSVLEMCFSAGVREERLPVFRCRTRPPAEQ